jgi:hypothetical protein
LASMIKIGLASRCVVGQARTSFRTSTRWSQKESYPRAHLSFASQSITRMLRVSFRGYGVLYRRTGIVRRTSRFFGTILWSSTAIRAPCEFDKRRGNVWRPIGQQRWVCEVRNGTLLITGPSSHCLECLFATQRAPHLIGSETVRSGADRRRTDKKWCRLRLERQRSCRPEYGI